MKGILLNRTPPFTPMDQSIPNRDERDFVTLESVGYPKTPLSSSTTLHHGKETSSQCKQAKEEEGVLLYCPFGRHHADGLLFVILISFVSSPSQYAMIASLSKSVLNRTPNLRESVPFFAPIHV